VAQGYISTATQLAWQNHASRIYAQHQFAARDQVSPAMTTSDQGCGSEFLSRVTDKCAYERGSKLPELGAWISR